MSGTDQRLFRELIPPFLKEKLALVEREHGPDSPEYRALARQYIADAAEQQIDFKAERRRHYDADLLSGIDGEPIRGMERLYRRVALIEPTTACVAHCRWCLRAQYDRFSLKEEELLRAVRYCGDETNRDDLREVLITGGDPLIIPKQLNFILDGLVEHAPNINVARIGSKLPVQDPTKVTDELLRALRPREGLRIELGTHVNNAIELWPESREAYRSLQSLGIRMYNQQVLLKDVNDDLDELVKLYDALRELTIEPHYMFHCIPMRGMNHHRTTVERGLELAKALTSCGQISGRAKPMYAAMTDVGKVTFYEGVVLDRKRDMLLLKTGYRYEDRTRWNPTWKLPEAASVDEEGYLRVWYQDAKVHNEGWSSTYVT